MNLHFFSGLSFNIVNGDSCLLKQIVQKSICRTINDQYQRKPYWLQNRDMNEDNNSAKLGSKNRISVSLEPNSKKLTHFSKVLHNINLPLTIMDLMIWYNLF